MKTQELYAVVFATRYLDIFTDFISLYNTIMKFIYLGSSFSIVWYIRHHKIVRRSYDKDQDTFRHYFLILPCLVLALFINVKFTFKEVCSCFSFTRLQELFLLFYLFLYVLQCGSGHVDIFLVSRSCCYCSSTRAAAENEKH